MAHRSRSTRALEVLELVATSGQPLRIADIVDKCKLPKATAHRICRLLRMQGYLRAAVDSRGLVPGPRLRTLASAALASQSENVVRHAVLEAVARKIGESCNFAVPDGTAMVYWDRAVSSWPLQVQLPIGARIPLHCTASGKVYLGSLPPGRRRRLLRRLPLERMTPNTIIEADALDAAAAEAAAAGVGTNNEEYIPGMIGVAVPVHSMGGHFIGTLSFHSPVSRMTLKQALSFADDMREGAFQLATEIAAEPSG